MNLYLVNQYGRMILVVARTHDDAWRIGTEAMAEADRYADIDDGTHRIGWVMKDSKNNDGWTSMGLESDIPVVRQTPPDRDWSFS